MFGCVCLQRSYMNSRWHSRPGINPHKTSHISRQPASNSQQWMTVRAQHHQRQRRRLDENHEKLAFNFSSLLRTSSRLATAVFSQPIRDFLAHFLCRLSAQGPWTTWTALDTSDIQQSLPSLLLLPFNSFLPLGSSPVRVFLLATHFSPQHSPVFRLSHFST